MGVRSIRPGNKNVARVIDVFITTGRRIHAERGLVSGYRRRHAQARVGIHVICADQPLAQFVKRVVILGQHLA